MRIGSSQEIREIDRTYIEDYGMPSIVLMENAALKLLKNLDLDKNNLFTIVCGNGNNGGYGLALARLLIANKKDIRVFFIPGKRDISKDCKTNLDILNKLDVKINNIHNKQDIHKLIDSIHNSDIVIDGILGTGLSRDVDGIYLDIIDSINKHSKYIISIDIPSGLNSDTGKVIGNCIRANKTITFQLYKIGFLNYESLRNTGEIVLEEINIPNSIIEKNHKNIFFTTEDFIKENIPRRDVFSHKGNFGRCLIFAGAIGFSGAAYICTESVVRSGGGLTTLCCDENIQNILSSKLTEAMTINYKNDYEEFIEKSDVIAIGPGMGINDKVKSILENLIRNYDKTLVIDADGLNVLSNNVEILKEANSKVVITPHLGEMARLTGLSIDYIKNNRVNVALNFARSNNIIVLLKGYNTIITDGVTTYINPTGNSSMASGGMGDCLTGIITSLIGQKLDPFIATVLGAYIHGYIGDKLSKNMYCVNATHIIDNIPYALKELQSI